MLINEKAVCPNNPNHKRFAVVAHVTQEWVVDNKGVFQECTEDCIDITHYPDSEDYWECMECGAEAIFIEA